MTLAIIGINHRTAPQDLRGRLAFALDDLRPSVQVLARSPRHPEAVLLSTCNRTELYVAGSEPLTQMALDWLADRACMDPSHLAAHAYVHESANAVRHAFRVASGLDSMVLGEPQILGQMKRAVREAQSAGTMGTELHRLFQRAFSAAKAVRAETALGRHSVSLAAACVRLAQERLGDLRRRCVLLVGAGETNENVAAHLSAQAPAEIAITNRHRNRADALAAKVGGRAIEWTEFGHQLGGFDLVISCTSSHEPVVGLCMVSRALAARTQPMLLIDLAVPRDIAPEVACLPDAQLVSLDALASRVQCARAGRTAAIADAESIIDRAVDDFTQRSPNSGGVDLIRALQTQADAWRAAELRRARRALARGDSVDEVLEALSRGLAQKMLHGAMTELRHLPSQDTGAPIAGTVSRLFLRCPVQRHTMHTAADSSTHMLDGARSS